LSGYDGSIVAGKVALEGDRTRLKGVIEQKDIFTLDLSKADVITLYLLPGLNVKLIPQLEKLKPGSRIVSHDFDMKGVKPDKVVKMRPSEEYGTHTVYLWTTPLKREKTSKKQASTMFAD